MVQPILARGLIAAALLATAACGPRAERPTEPPAGAQASTAPAGSLAWAAAGPWRIAPERDRYRHPVETLSFFGIRNDMHVIEVYPGRGWYTAILAPYLANGGGTLTVAAFDPAAEDEAQRKVLEAFKTRFADVETYGEIRYAVLTPTSGPLMPDGSADMALVLRNVHTLMAAGFAEKAFADLHRALKPGGLLGIEQHRAAPSGLQDPLATNGYVQEAYVRALAEEAGFEFVGASEINANPKDTKDHPFGVWTLPPILRTAPVGQPDDPNFDTARYRQIGESDRMTLLFRKPE